MDNANEGKAEPDKWGRRRRGDTPAAKAREHTLLTR